MEFGLIMIKEYVIFEAGMGGASCEISEDEYEKIKRHREVIVTAFSIEETFSLAARSYIDLEKVLMTASLEWGLVDADYAPHNDFFDHWREVINLNLISLLTAGGAYTEKMDGIAKSVSIPGFDWGAYDPCRREVYDSDLCYRVMCAVRNFSIHDKLPISGASVDFKNEAASGTIGEGGPWRNRLTCSPYIRTQPLVASNKINKKTRNEMEELDVKGLDLKFFTRGYVESLFALHCIVRDLTESSLKEALRSLSEMESRLSKVKGEKCKLPYIGEKGAGLENAQYIDTARLSRIQGKRQGWKKLKNLRRRYISTETTQRKGISLGESKDIWVQA